jgi:hypothetical protein
MKLICLDPSIGFDKVMANFPLSLMIVSGTLSPLEAWEMETR